MCMFVHVCGKATFAMQVMAEMKITDVDKVFDDINEQNDQMRQISEAMGQPIGVGAELDEDDLEAELRVRHCTA
jgi:hypothetical protein